MKKLQGLKKRLPRMSRKGRIVCNLLLSLVLAAAVWQVLGAPLPLVLEFRRAEKINLVGPSEIIAVVRGENLELDELPEKFYEYHDDYMQSRVLERFKDFDTVIGEQDGYLVWFWNIHKSSCDAQEKTGEVTICRMYEEHYGRSYFHEDGEKTSDRMVNAALISIQTDLPGAYYANLEWRGYIRGTDTIDTFTNWCSGTGTVQDNGVFVIPVLVSSDPVADNEGINGRFDLNEAHLVLTDENGTVIYDEVLIVED